MKTETLEEAAKKHATNPGMMLHIFPEKRESFIAGAKWQEEIMYSEQEVIELLQKYRLDLSRGKTPNIGNTTRIWLEQFKKK